VNYLQLAAAPERPPPTIPQIPPATVPKKGTALPAAAPPSPPMIAPPTIPAAHCQLPPSISSISFKVNVLIKYKFDLLQLITVK